MVSNTRESDWKKLISDLETRQENHIIDVSGFDLDNAELERLATAINNYNTQNPSAPITGLDLSRNNLTPSGLSNVAAHLPNLTLLVLDGNAAVNYRAGVRDKDAGAFHQQGAGIIAQHFRNLVTLQMRGCELDDDGLDRLLALPNLKHLDVRVNPCICLAKISRDNDHGAGPSVCNGDKHALEDINSALQNKFRKLETLQLDGCGVFNSLEDTSPAGQVAREVKNYVVAKNTTYAASTSGISPADDTTGFDTTPNGRARVVGAT